MEFCKPIPTLLFPKYRVRIVHIVGAKNTYKTVLEIYVIKEVLSESRCQIDVINYSIFHCRRSVWAGEMPEITPLEINPPRRKTPFLKIGLCAIFI